MDVLAARPEPSVSVDAGRPRHREAALADIRDGFAHWKLARTLAWLDIRNRYRGSVLGPFWLSLSTAAMILGLGVLYSALLRTDVATYLPYLAISLICWNMIAQTVNEACASLTGAEGVIRQIKLPYTVHVLRCVVRNVIVAAHNVPLLLIVFLAFGVVPDAGILLLPLGLLIFAVNAFATAMFLGMACARFRDIGQIVGSVMQIAFFLSPIIWKRELLAGSDWIVWINPFYLVMETIRGPLIHGGGEPLVWVLALLLTAANVAVSFAAFVRFRSRIAFWV